MPTPVFNPMLPPLTSAVELLIEWFLPLCEGEPEPRIVGLALQVGGKPWCCELTYQEAAHWSDDDVPRVSQLLAVAVSNGHRFWFARSVIPKSSPDRRRFPFWKIEERAVGRGPKRAPNPDRLRREHKEILSEVQNLRRWIKSGRSIDDFPASAECEPGSRAPVRRSWLEYRGTALRGDGTSAPPYSLRAVIEPFLSAENALTDASDLAYEILGLHHGLSADRVRTLAKANKSRV